MVRRKNRKSLPSFKYYSASLKSTISQVEPQTIPPENSSVELSIPPEHSSLKQSIPSEHSSVELSIPSEHSSLKQSIPPEHSSLELSIPPEHSSLKLSIPPVHSSLGVCYAIDISPMKNLGSIAIFVRKQYVLSILKLFPYAFLAKFA